MCDFGSIMLAGEAAVAIGGSLVKARAQNQQASQAALAAQRSKTQGIAALTLREGQEQDSAGMSIMQADRQARMADAQARVSAGEAGVAGASVDALLGDIQRQDLEFKTNTNTNLTNTISQLESEKTGVRVQAANQAAAYPRASNLATGLNIAGSLFGLGSLLVNRKPK